MDEKGTVFSIKIEPPPIIRTLPKILPKPSGFGLKSKKVSPKDTEASSNSDSRNMDATTTTTVMATHQHHHQAKNDPVPSLAVRVSDARDVACGLWMSLGLVVFLVIEVVAALCVHSDASVTEVFFVVFLLCAMMGGILVLLAQLGMIFQWKPVESLVDWQSDIEMFVVILLNIVVMICVLDVGLVCRTKQNCLSSLTFLRMHIFCSLLVASLVYPFILTVKLYQRCRSK